MTELPGPLWGHRMIEDEIDHLLTEKGVGALSLTDGETPYTIPISFGYDGESRLYFLFVGHSEEGRKASYADSTAKAGFLVFDVASETEWRSVIAEGELGRIRPEEWDDAREAMAANAYQGELIADHDGFDDPRVWRLEIEELTGRAVE
jgi:nitroimidazol reductase NimA-like FMN-containing flavoprotein (pyridoxamine 5'-phosphate oxidase superfamily)